MTVLAFVESVGGVPDRLSLEMLTLARQVADGEAGRIEAILFDPSADAAAATLGAHGVSTVTRVEHDALTDFAPVAWAAAIAQRLDEMDATVVLGPGSDRGNEVMAHLAARTSRALATNCTAIEGGEPWRLTRQRWAGSLLEDATLEGPVRLLTVAAHVAEPEPAAVAIEPSTRTLRPQLSAADLHVRVARREAPDAGRMSLADARVVVGGGRGVGNAEGFADLEELAALLGGAVGVSRAVTSAGWRPHAEQIGQTGLRIAPEVYIACGISGAIQHIVGCKAARHILAINSDPDAPIMEKAHTAVIGDLRTIVPAINEELRRPR